MPDDALQSAGSFGTITTGAGMAQHAPLPPSQSSQPLQHAPAAAQPPAAAAPEAGAAPKAGPLRRLLDRGEQPDSFKRMLQAAPWMADDGGGDGSPALEDGVGV